MEHETIDTASGKPELVTAEESLAALFNLGLACDKKTYQGTIRPLAGGQGPGSEEVVGQDPLVLLHDRRGGGNEDYTGYAIGWTRGKSAWLVIADAGEPAARAMVGALVEAGG